MKGWRRLLVCALAAGFLAGMAGPLQAAGMAPEWAATAQSSHSDDDDRNDCGDAPDEKSCMTLCAAHAQAVVPQAAKVPPAAFGRDAAFDDRAALHGRTCPPDPGPPRSRDIA